MSENTTLSRLRLSVSRDLGTVNPSPLWGGARGDPMALIPLRAGFLQHPGAAAFNLPVAAPTRHRGRSTMHP